MRDTRCPICRIFDDAWGRHTIPKVEQLADGKRIECVRCGNYELRSELEGVSPPQATALSWAVRRETDAGRICSVTDASIEGLVREAPVFSSASEQEDYVVGLVAEACGGVGESSEYIARSAFAARACMKAMACDRYLAELANEDYFKMGGDGVAPSYKFRLNRKGWHHADARKSPKPERTEAPVGAPANAAGCRFDVALSFAGEDREHAEKLATALKAEGISVFYDLDHEAELWGEDLGRRLEVIYGSDSRHVVMFISADYARKEWTNYERETSVAKAIKQKGTAYILPIRIDDTEIPGVSSTRGYVPIERGIQHIASLILEKLGRQHEPENPVLETRLAVEDSLSSPSTQIPGLTAQASEVLQRACELVLRDDLVPAFIDGGEDFLAQSDRPVSRENCRDAIDLLEEQSYVSAQEVFGTGRKWASFTVTSSGFAAYIERFMPDAEQRSNKVIKEVVERALTTGLHTSGLAKELGEKHAFVALVLEDLIARGQLKGDRIGDGGWCVFSPAASLRWEHQDVANEQSAEPAVPTLSAAVRRTKNEGKAGSEPSAQLHRRTR